MISSTTSADRAPRPEQLPPAAKPLPRPEGVQADRISTENAEFLRAALARQPEIRPEMVARGRELAADPSYPPTAALRNVAEQILASPDLSEDEA